MSFQLNEGFVRRILGKLKFGLCHGLGTGEKGNVCVQHAVWQAEAEEMGHTTSSRSDEPSCVYYGIRTFMVAINDSRMFSSDLARARVLKRLAIAQLGSVNWLRDEKTLDVFKQKVGEAVQALIDKCTSGRVVYVDSATVHLRQFSYTGQFVHAAEAILSATKAVTEDGEARDDFLEEALEDVVNVFCDMGAPGAAYLPMTLQD